MAKKSEAPPLKVIPGDDPPAPEVLAQAIVDISTGMKLLGKSRLNKRAILVLLKDATGVGLNDISLVLNGLNNLEQTYLKPKA